MKNQYPNRSWGEIKDGVFLKKVSYLKHFMRKFNSWGFDKELILKYIHKCNALVLFDEDNRIYYVTTPEIFLRHSFKFDFGFREQLFLSLNHWEKASTEEEVDKTIKEFHKSKQNKLF